MLGFSRPMAVSDSVIIDATSDELYDAVSDPRNMGRWSPENLGAEVDHPGWPAFVGMSFTGANKRGLVRWRTRCEVTDAERGRRFAFRVHRYGYLVPPVLPVRVASWTYDFEPVDGGTKVTETWTDDRVRWPDLVADQFDRVATGGLRFRDFQLKNIRRTLANLKSDFESR